MSEPLPIRNEPLVSEIQAEVACHFGLTVADLLSERRSRRFARPRQFAMYLCRELTNKSLPEIGRRFGSRDHTTVMHAMKTMEQVRADSAEYNDALIACSTRLAQAVADRMQPMEEAA